jgi:hypothetical protein
MPKSTSGQQIASQDLIKMFGSALEMLSNNRQELNQLDGHNGNHGDNMVQIFDVITNALTDNKDQPVEKSLSRAATQVRKIQSGSAQVYAQNLEEAAEQVKGNKLDLTQVATLLTTLLGAGQAAKAAPEPKADPLGSLLSGLIGGGAQEQEQEDKSVDWGSLLMQGGMAFMQAKQTGDDNLGAGMKALLSASSLGQAEHRQQSATLITEGLLSVLPELLKSK